MRISFGGLEHGIDLKKGHPFVLEVQQEHLFARICQAIYFGEGRYAQEPYTVWEGEKELNPSTCFICALSPLELPWDNKALMTNVLKTWDTELLEDEELRSKIDQAAQLISSAFLSLGNSRHASYDFAVEWSMQKFLKAFGFGVEDMSHESVFDSLNTFLSLALDARCNKTLVFVNFKNFLTSDELKRLYEYVFFSNLQVLLLENTHDDRVFEYEHKLCVDQHFIES